MSTSVTEIPSSPPATDAVNPRAAARRATIALLIESDGPGGAEIMLMQTAEELRRRGHRVITVGPHKGCGWLRAQLELRGFTYETFELRRTLDWRCVQGLVALVRRHDIEVLHSHEFTMAVYCGAAAALTGTRHVTTMHGSSRMLVKWTRRMALRLAFAGARVVGVSADTSRHLEKTLRLRAGAVTSIGNGIRPTPGDREPVRQELGLRDDDLLIVAVGNLVPRKGHIHLLRALATLDRAGIGSRWHLAIAGRGTERDALLAFGGDAGFADRLHLLGHRDDVANILAASDIYVMPSLWEGLPVALLEAMFAGKPIVASGVSGIPEAIRHEREGFLTPPGDDAAIAKELGRLLQDSALRTKTGAAAHARAVEAYSVEVMVDEYEKVFGLR